MTESGGDATGTTAQPQGGDPRLAELGWAHVYSGKVRDLYRHASHPKRMLVVATDRVSAFDFVLEPGIPGKGAELTRLSRWWFDRLDVPNHLDPAGLPADLPEDVAARAMFVRELEMFPVEAVVRGYLTGSGWVEYQASRTVCGIPLPDGLGDGDRLPEPIYTPAYKAPLGEHDENISFERTVELVGEADATAIRDLSIRIFSAASNLAAEHGVIIADTKFEFGRDPRRARSCSPTRCSRVTRAGTGMRRAGPPAGPTGWRASTSRSCATGSPRTGTSRARRPGCRRRSSSARPRATAS